MDGGDNRYQYNGIERNEDLGLNVDMARFRTLDPTIGRWLQVDPLTEIAPEWTSYRFGFDNPLSYSDPFGLFEDRKEAHRYKRDHDLRGRIRKNKDRREDGSVVVTYSIDNRDENTSISRDAELGVITAVLVTPEQEESSQQNGFFETTGPYAAWASSVATTAGELQHSGRFGLDVWRGQNGKFYSQSAAPGRTRPFYGNQYTGSINKAKAIARPIKIGGTILGIYNYAAIVEGHHSGNLTTGQLVGEASANTVTTFGGIYGVAVGIGWEAGRAITNTQGYQNWKRDKWLPVRQKYLGY